MIRNVTCSSGCAILGPMLVLTGAGLGRLKDRFMNLENRTSVEQKNNIPKIEKTYDKLKSGFVFFLHFMKQTTMMMTPTRARITARAT